VAYELNFGLIWPQLWRIELGLLLSLALTAGTVVFGSAIGLLLALMRLRGSWQRRCVTVYVEFFRNTPLLLLVYLMYYGLPSALEMGDDPTLSFLVTLSLFGGAYLTEVFRAGLAAVPAGLEDAGRALGLSRPQLLLLVRLPMMLRVALPSFGNTVVSLFKDTSIASVIAVPEMMFGAQWINLNTFRIIEIYMVVAPIYLVASSLLFFMLRRLERRFALVER
jgi:polar amino acid transport system permease protein